MPQHFDFSATVEGEWGVLVASGELDLAAEPDLHAHLRALLDGGVRHVIVDLRQVTFMDSTSLGALIGADRQLRGSEPAGSLRVVCTDERVIRVFRITGLLEMFPMHASVEQARAADPSGDASE